MHYHQLFHQLYSELRTIPDFPCEKADQLWSKMPKGSRDMAAAMYLLPFGNDAASQELHRAKIIMLLTLSAFTHGDLEKNHAFADGEAVLYGDYLFALAISMVPEDFPKNDAEALLTRSYRFGEHRLSHNLKSEGKKDYVGYARSDYGELLKGIAEEGAVGSGMEENAAKRYAAFAETLGTAWGILCEGYPADPLPLLNEAENLACGLPQEETLLQIIHDMRGATNENRS